MNNLMVEYYKNQSFQGKCEGDRRNSSTLQALERQKSVERGGGDVLLLDGGNATKRQRSRCATCSLGLTCHIYCQNTSTLG